MWVQGHLPIRRWCDRHQWCGDIRIPVRPLTGAPSDIHGEQRLQGYDASSEPFKPFFQGEPVPLRGKYWLSAYNEVDTGSKVSVNGQVGDMSLIRCTIVDYPRPTQSVTLHPLAVSFLVVLLFSDVSHTAIWIVALGINADISTSSRKARSKSALAYYT